MKTILKILIGVLVGGLVLIVGCVALVGVGADEAVKEIDREHNATAITNKQARALKLGTTRREVEQQFGPPASDQEGTNEGLGDDSCVYYGVRDSEDLSQWQLCFSGTGMAGKLRSKNRL